MFGAALHPNILHRSKQAHYHQWVVIPNFKCYDNIKKWKY